MLEVPKFLTNSYSIFFQRVSDIRKKANNLEDKLQGKYNIPQILGIPDEIDPAAPRIIFGSRHGYSQIVVSQISIAFNVVYGDNFHTNKQARDEYLTERIPQLYTLLSEINAKPYYAGFVSEVVVPSDEPDEAILRRLSSLFVEDIHVNELYDIEFKLSTVIEKKYFSNVTTGNYRLWAGDGEGNAARVTRLPAGAASQRGLRIVLDINDRYAFNEDKAYRSSREVYRRLLEYSEAEITSAIARVSGKAQ